MRNRPKSIGGTRRWSDSALLLLAWVSVAQAAPHSTAFQDEVLDIRLTVELSALQQLADKPQEFVRAEMRCWDQTFAQVGICLRPQMQEVVAERKPNFIVKLDQFQAGQKLAGVREFIIEQSIFDSSLMDRFVAARLASRIGVPCPIYSHARLSLNGRPLGLYAVIERVNEGFLGRTTGNRAGVLMDAQQIVSDGASGPESTTSSQQKAFVDSLHSALQKKGAESLTALDDLFDLKQVFRFMAWETFIRNTAGYTHSGSNGWIYVGEKTGKGELLPGNLFRLFTASKMHVLGGKEGALARRLLESTEGRRRFINAIALIATNGAIENEMAAEIEQRAALLTLHLGSSAELRGLESHTRSLQKALKKRFASVRLQLEELSSLSDLELASFKLPVVRMSDFARPQKLPVNGEVPDYVGQFRKLMESPSILTSSVPVKIYQIALTAPNGLLENLPRETTNWISVTAVCDGRRFEKAGCRLKGHGNREGFQGKPNFTLKFNMESKGQGFEGNSKIHVQNATYNASMLNEYLASWVFQRAGLPCPRVNYARLTVNGVDYGVMVVVEGTTKSFLQREFGEDEGMLFEGEYSDINGRLDLDSGTVPPGYDSIHRLYEGAVQALQSGSLNALTNALNMAQFSRFVAAEIALGHADGYALSANNYRFYQPLHDTRFQFIPHGMDRLVMDQKDVIPEAKGVLAKALFHTAAGRETYTASLRELLITSIDMPQLLNDGAAVCRELQAALKKSDPLQAPAQLGSALALMARFGDRKAYLLEKLQQTRTNSIPVRSSQRAHLTP